MDFNKYSLFKLPNRYKRFEYVPRYYDERKEKLRKKIAAYEQEANAASSEKVRREITFRDKTGDRWGNDDYKAASMRQNLRLLIILVALGIVVYYIFMGIDGIEPIIEKFY